MDKGPLKLRLSPQTPVDPAKLIAWVRERRDAQLNPDGAVLVPLPPAEAAPFSRPSGCWRPAVLLLR